MLTFVVIQCRWMCWIMTWPPLTDAVSQLFLFALWDSLVCFASLLILWIITGFEDLVLFIMWLHYKFSVWQWTYIEFYNYNMQMWKALTVRVMAFTVQRFPPTINHHHQSHQSIRSHWQWYNSRPIVLCDLHALISVCYLTVESEL